MRLTREVGRNGCPVLELHALVGAGAVVHAAHAFWTAVWRHGLKVRRHRLPAYAQWIEHVQAEGGGALHLGAVHALLIADAELLAAVAELLSLLILYALKAASGRGTASITCLLLQAKAALLLVLISNAVQTAMQCGWQRLLLLVIVQGNIAQLQLAADVLGILDIDTLVGARMIAFRAAWATVHDASLIAVADLCAANLQALAELVDAALVVTVAAWLGRAF